MQIQAWARQNAPSLLSGAAVVGVVATVVLAVKATPKAGKKIEEAEIAKNDSVWSEADQKQIAILADDYKPLTKIEVVKATWRVYLPATISGVATIACIIGSNQIGIRKNAALIGAYTLLDTTFRNYKDEVVALVGEKKEEAVRDRLVVKQMEANPPSSEVILVGGGDVLCYESLSGRYFRGDAETIRRAENEFNRELLNNRMYCDLNLWYDYLGLDPTGMGAVLGWSVERILDIHFTSHLSGDGKPCLAIGYKYMPFEDFGKL